ncbi:MAG: hypothetical protein ABW131_05380 [Candidatus Sedimenticola sp. 6PFRAG5]
MKSKHKKAAKIIKAVTAGFHPDDNPGGHCVHASAMPGNSNANNNMTYLYMMCLTPIITGRRKRLFLRVN